MLQDDRPRAIRLTNDCKYMDISIEPIKKKISFALYDYWDAFSEKVVIEISDELIEKINYMKKNGIKEMIIE